MLRLLTVLLVVLLMSIAAGCTTPPPATDTPPDPLALIKEAADKLRAADTFRIDVNESGPNYTMYTEYATVFFRRASAQYVAPGIMQASLRVIAAGLPLDIQVFSRGAEQWYRAIWTADTWVNQAFAPDFNPATLVAEESGFQAALDALIDLTYIGTTQLENGVGVFHLSATANGPDVSALLGGLISPIGTVDVGVYINQSTGYPTRFVITEYDSPYAVTPEAGQETEPIVWTIDIYDINAPAELSTPEAMSDSEEMDNMSTDNIQEFFRQKANTLTSPYGEVSNYDSSVNTEERFLVDIDVSLNASSNSRSIARNVIESLFRGYIDNVEQGNRGKITVLVTWVRNGLTCNETAGMGYRVMQEINWSNANQINIFDAMDKGLFSDTTDYLGVAFAPHLDGIPECNV